MSVGSVGGAAVTFSAGLLANRPTAGILGRRYYATDTDTEYVDTGSAWTSAHPKTMRQAWTYTLPGSLAVPSGSNDFLPPAGIVVPSGQGVTLVGYQWYLGFGTSFTFSMIHATGATLGTLTTLASGIVAAAASVKGAGTFGTPKVCADGDAWYPQITAISGSPIGGSVTILADVTV